MSNKTEVKTEPSKRVRLGCMVKPENLEAIKAIKDITESRSEGVVMDSAIEHYKNHVNRRFNTTI